MVTSDPIESLIPWYANGTLPDGDRRRVEEHLARCAECRSLLDESRALEDLGAGDARELLDHVQAQHLEQYARDPDGLRPELAAWIRSHLEGCEACRGAHRLLERVLEDPELSPTIEPPDEAEEPAEAPRRRTIPPVAAAHPRRRSRLVRTLLHPAAAAVYLAGLILAVPLYRGLVHLPDVERRTASGGQRLEAPVAGGAVDLPVVSSVFRGESGQATVTVSDDQPLVPVAAELELPDGIDASAAVRFRISRDDERVWSDELDAGRVATNLDESGLVVLLVPASLLEPGSHRLSVEAAGRTLLDAPFEVVRPR